MHSAMEVAIRDIFPCKVIQLTLDILHQQTPGCRHLHQPL